MFGHFRDLLLAFIDIADRIMERLPLFLLYVIGVTFIVLAMAFRSVVIALTAAITTILSAFVGFGVLTLVIQEGYLMSLMGLDVKGPIETFVPPIAFAILFGLSMDYMVFLTSRIREEHVHGLTTRPAVEHGIAAIGRVVVAAAIIMATVFSAFILTPERVSKEFGLLLAVAILTDALIVKMTLIPAFMTLIGEKTWYMPRWLDRLLPNLTIEQMRYKLLSRYRAHGLLGVSGAGDVFGGIGPAKPDPRLPGYPGRNALREELVERGELVTVSVEGISGKRFVLRDELELLKAPPEPASSVAFLSPFDPLVWDRKLLDSLFGFHYVWELFLPPAKRRWGWYVLPILFGDRLVGRLEPRIEREGGRVQILDVWWEEGFRPGRVDGFVEAMRDALRAYLEFAGASRLEWGSHLGPERRRFGTRP